MISLSRDASWFHCCIKGCCSLKGFLALRNQKADGITRCIGSHGVFRKFPKKIPNEASRTQNYAKLTPRVHKVMPQ